MINNISQNDILCVSEWLNTSVDNLDITITNEPISLFKKQILEMFNTYEEFPEDAKRTDKIISLLKSGAEPSPIYIDSKDLDLFVMEGRHRMVAFYLLDLEFIPVANVSLKNTISKKLKIK